MSELEKNLVGFRRRVRWMRAWKGLAIGGTIGALISFVLSTLDFFRVAYASWLWLAIPIAVGLIGGAIVGFFLRLRVNDLADSIDRRASLENRLGTAAEGIRDEMGQIQRGDALAHLQGLKPAAVFPVRVSRWHGGMLAMSVLAASIFLLGNTPLFLNEKEKAEREEMKEMAATIEKVVKPVIEKDPEVLAPETKELAKELQELKRELERGRMPKEEALQKANKLAEKAEKTAIQKFQQSDKQMATAQEQLEMMAKEDALKELGLSEQDFDKAELEKASEMTEEERKEMANEMSKQLSQMQSELGMKSENNQSSQNSQNSESSDQNSQESANQQKSLQEQMKSMEQQLKDIQSQLESGKDAKGNQLSKEQLENLQKLSKQLQELMKQLKLSEKIQEFMEKLQSMKEFQDIQKLMQKLAEMNQKGQQGQMDKSPEMSEKELQEMKKQMEEAMKKLEEQISKMSDADMKKMLEDMKKALEEAIKNGMQACQNGGMCMKPGMGMMPGMGMGMGMPGMGGMPGPGMPSGGMPSWGPSGPGQDQNFRNIDAIPLNKDPQDIKAGALPISTSGQRQDRGSERYTEIRGPVKPGEKSQTPYYKVLPKYKKQAEDALNKDRIPKEHQKRVKEYFDSLTKGGK